MSSAFVRRYLKMLTPLIRTISTAAALILIQAASTMAQDMSKIFEPSADEFRNSCASCHGVDGKGAGFLTRLFRGIDPGDLSQLAKNNDGDFPFDRVF